VVISQCFRVISHADSKLLLEVQTSKNMKWVDYIRRFLVSNDPTEIYLFVSCMNELDPQLWAGTNPEIASAFEAWEVERVMQLLDSQDVSIRKKVLFRNMHAFYR
jgi:AP-4 complex subunit epsilon-1